MATGWLGQVVATGRLGHSAQGRKATNHAGKRVNGEATGQTVAGGERADSLVTGEGKKGLIGGARLLERANARGGGGRAGVAGWWGRADSGMSRARAREVGRAGLRAGR